MLDFGGLLSAILGIFEGLFSQILGPLFDLFGGVFPGA
jgi:hypothetical protein